VCCLGCGWSVCWFPWAPVCVQFGDEWVHTLCYAWLDVVVALFCVYNNIQHALSPAIPIAIWLCARYILFPPPPCFQPLAPAPLTRAPPFPAIPIAVWLCAKYCPPLTTWAVWGCYVGLQGLVAGAHGHVQQQPGRAGQGVLPPGPHRVAPVLLGTLLAFGIPTAELWYAALQLGLCCIADGLPLWIASLNFQVQSQVTSHKSQVTCHRSQVPSHLYSHKSQAKSHKVTRQGMRPLVPPLPLFQSSNATLFTLATDFIVPVFSSSPPPIPFLFYPITVEPRRAHAPQGRQPPHLPLPLPYSLPVS